MRKSSSKGVNSCEAHEKRDWMTEYAECFDNKQVQETLFRVFDSGSKCFDF